jgi:hypothetical protein
MIAMKVRRPAVLVWLHGTSFPKLFIHCLFAASRHVTGKTEKATQRHVNWCPEPESNRHAGFTQATDFKSVVSTNFTTRADTGGETRNRTGIGGFAIRCITILLSRRTANQQLEMSEGKPECFPSDLEREKSLELSTYTLARYRSTN